MEYELLAPVGDWQSLRAAIDAGADAVYFGIKGFNMRDAARNFSLRDLRKIRKICGDVKMYLTLNVVVYDSELKKVERIVRRARDFVDAVVCWDLGVIEICRKYKVPFHVSTQASVSNVASALFYKKLGARRIVLARELSLKQIAKISKVVDVECFCHGAMCVAVSGRCFMSQFVYGSSANRGRCCQLCRRSWKIIDDDPIGQKSNGAGGKELRLENSRVMSAKDLCTLPFVNEMKKAGVKAFKIEGRNRPAEYVSVVVGEYRKAIDGYLGYGGMGVSEGVKKGIENLKRVYNRGFSSGFYLGLPTADDFSISENGEQKEKKEFIGRVYKYWPRVGVCALKISAGGLRVGDEVYLISDLVGCKRSKVLSIELDGERVEVAGKSQDVGVVFDGADGKLRGAEVYGIRTLRGRTKIGDFR